MYISSPAWSFKGKYSNDKVTKTPTPSTYSPDNWKTMKSPSWMIGKQKRYKNNTQHNPGPGQYETNSSTKTNYLGKFGLQKYRTFQTNTNPDPAQYSPKHSYNKTSSPSHSFYLEGKPEAKQNSPGVGSYLLNKSTLEKGIKIYQQKRFQGDEKNYPGPGAYQSSRIPFSSISVNFTKDQKIKRDTVHKKQPGPGHYEATDFISTNSKLKKGYTIPSKKQNNYVQESPGPLSYDPTTYSSKFSGVPHVSMKGNRDSSHEAKSPGPAEYSPKTASKTFVGSVTIGKANRNFDLQTSFNPGPGAYEKSQSIHKQNPKYSIPSTGRKDKKIYIPGPGAYEPSIKSTKNRPQSAKIGREKRYEEKGEMTPGPGEYNLNTRQVFGKQSFTKQKKEEKNRTKTPGPGDYTLNSTLGNLPSYAIK